jgi:hypothetical protein
MTLDLHQRKVLALEVWNARDFIIDCREELGNAGADDETLRQLSISINHLAKIAEDLEYKTPEEIKLWGPVEEETDADEHGLGYQRAMNDVFSEMKNEEYVKNVWAREEVNAAEDHESETQHARNGF